MQGLYLVTPNWDDTDQLLAATGTALRAGATLVQYRHKTASAELRAEQAAALLALCRAHGRPLVINDYVELAQELDADGVHVGGTDVSVAQARAALGPDKIVGASCYGDLQRARDAQAAGATYAAFGGFYPSLVKQYDFRTDPQVVAQARRELAVPLVVIGGMTPERAAPLVALGADMVAAISAVFTAPDVHTAAREFVRLFGATGR
jgi:thiamine-phosphate pyrophosphorylase